jgi:hypothetical protein
MDEVVYTIPEYCAAEKISRAMLYAEWAKGEGVEFFRRGTKILITHQARLRYREKLEQNAREERANRFGVSVIPSEAAPEPQGAA